MKLQNNLIGTSLFVAVTASLCCIAPLLALIVGTAGAVTVFSWVEPFRPYLIFITISVLTFTWYQRLKPKTQEEIDCTCDTDQPRFINSKEFLIGVTLLAGVLLAFPCYSSVFYPHSTVINEEASVLPSNLREIKVAVAGMTCAGCEAHIENEVIKLGGILTVDANYEGAIVAVKFDERKVKIETIEKSITKTGYKIIK